MKMRKARFKDLIPENEVRRLLGPVEIEVKGLTYRSQDVKPGSVFVAIPGTHADGHEFIPQALNAGATALIVRKVSPKIAPEIAVAQVDDPRRTLAHAAARFYGHPSRRIPLIGITGTNGKTTTTYLLESIWKAEGHKTAVIGTVNYRLGNDVRPAAVTTPESLDIERLLSEMIEAGAESAAVEVSSHAIEQGRVWGLRFAARGFSNLSRDHLDYHGTMEAYFEAKARFFTDPEFADSGPAAINADDPYGLKLIETLGNKASSYGIDTRIAAALRPLEWKADLNGIRAKVRSPRTTYQIRSKLLGRANLYNVLCAMALAEIVQVSPEAITHGIYALDRVPGRLEQVPNNRGILVAVDYSHTPDALEKAILTLRELTRGRLLVVFGCGGDRDRGKRPIMGKVASELGDVAIVTSDNPRSEEPMAIISEILKGITTSRRVELNELHKGKSIHWVEPDRRFAIFGAIDAAKEGDTVLIAGKGHENYQILGDKRIHFDDREVVMEAFSEEKENKPQIAQINAE